MEYFLKKLSTPVWWVAISILALAFSYLVWQVSTPGASLMPPLFFLSLAAFASVVFTGLVMLFFNQWLQFRSIKVQAEWMQRQLQSAVRLNQLLVDAEDEEQLVERSLEIFSDLVGAVGSSFMPLDEWGQPLKAYTHGKLPQPVLRGWAEFVTSSSIRQECRACQKHHAMWGTPCPLMENPLPGSFNIHCQPLWRGDRMVGMLNLYIPPEHTLPPDIEKFIQSMLEEMVLAIETIRLQRQELNTLRYLQLHSPQADLKTLLSHVIDSIYDALEVDIVYLDVRRTGASFPGFQLVRGSHPWLESDGPALLTSQIYQNMQLAEEVRSTDGVRNLMVFPLRLPEGQVVGIMLVGTERPAVFSARHVTLLYTVAAQAAQLIDSERNRLSVELRSVLQERIRLAREVHDGLAQTLAFLKLNGAQMQAYLARHELDKLANALQENYETLSEAYLDTRQIIDNLRISPEDGISVWLDQLCRDFERSSSITVDLSCTLDDALLSPEVQSQLMRIVQEALNNVRKHAGASRVSVILREWQGDVLVEVQDNGSGFSPEDVPVLSRHGLRGMQERADMIGADFQVISQPDQGTTIRLRLPINMEETHP